MLTNNANASQIKLARPGAGLPFFEWLVAKYFLFPAILRNNDQQEARNKFAQVTAENGNHNAQARYRSS